MKINLPPGVPAHPPGWLGGIGVLCQLDAEVAMRAEIARWVPGFVEDS